MAASSGDDRLLYFAGDEPDDGALQFLLVSSSQFYVDELQKHLSITKRVQWGKRSYYVRVHTCKHIRDVIALKSKYFTVDFIIFIVDVKQNNCLTEILENMNALDSSFQREKTCIVNPNPSYLSAVNPFKLWEFANKYQINLINGRMNDPEQAANLSKRVLNLAEACCGALNGFPLIGYV